MTCTVNLLDDINPDEAVKTTGRGREDEASEKKKKIQRLVVGNLGGSGKSEKYK